MVMESPSWGSKPKPAEFSDSQKLLRQNGFQVNWVALASNWESRDKPFINRHDFENPSVYEGDETASLRMNSMFMSKQLLGWKPLRSRLAGMHRMREGRMSTGILAQMSCYGKTVKSCWNGEKSEILKFPPVWA